ncbi:glycosyl hydrolase family 28 protein [Glycomyces buryatensis]|uniref:Endo-polygalacturonase n=1 Tax=Glycomyces buryatensis TaxID=2570927 RepID=A0A4S8QD24_9ACTN|nr:glycosyl hydrolase family 28 protein [Glycomyces buryatensis]THV42447.1 endo-polygalacturonase [Glycomyces buryatensis]
MLENPPYPSLSRRTVLQATGAAAVAGYLATAANPASAQEASAENSLVTYPVPEGVEQNDSFNVRVRTSKGEWQPLGVYNTHLKMIDANTGAGPLHDSAVAYFDFTGTAEVQVTYTKGAIENARIRPLSHEIEPTVDDDSLKFTISEPRKLVIEVNDEVYDCLHLIANPIETDAPSADDPSVVYFGPGVHTGEGIAVASGQTVYIAGGAVVKRNIRFNGVENATLRGRGMIYGVEWGAAPVESSKNILIDGITIMNNPTGNAFNIAESQQVTVRNLNYFSSARWGDGIDIFSSSDVLIDGAFMRSSDDCIAVYAHRWEYYGDVRNITIQNSVLWADVAHPINIGTHGNSDEPEVLENITISNLDILDHREPQLDYQGCIALNPGDSNLVRNVRIQDIRIEDFRWGQIIHFRVTYNPTYNTSIGRGIESVFVKNLSYDGNNASTAMMLGYDAEHAVKDVVFQNFTVNGKVISDTAGKPRWYKTTDMVPMHVNEHVTGLRFLDSTTAPSDTAPTLVAAETMETTAGAPTIYTISATGFPETFAASGLPEGLAVDAATGVVAGAPAKAGTYDVVVSAANASGIAEQAVQITVQ